ncbi:radical SAM protein [Butyrivibrio sp. INlla16]|uniref:radical SAM protein n=1 Tax=Butyrivibrio sp. INlla16 TaxID=1520807 RepID=UPI0008805B22|nr:radical SAM protein [Butyrivibrio sp. INlla16]SDB60094.1 Radical SAM superfamily enzyme, MoaA/NifB/PqqE/SkfB family [Butyrivibrio sp. INlla16]
MDKATPYSNLKIFAHAEALNKIGNGERIAPIYIRIKPTNYCNHRCYYCSYADSALGLRDSVNKQDQIPWDKMQEIINDMGDMGVKAVTFSGGGEPLVYPHIVQAMEGMLDKKIDLSIITNGQLLKDEKAEVLTKAKWVRVSFDSANAATYARTRSIPESAFEETCENLKHFAKIKGNDCELGVNFVINHENADQVLEMAKLTKQLGVNHIKFAARVTKDLFEYHAPFKESVIEQLHKAEELNGDGFRVINKYEGDFDSALVFSRKYDKCYINRIFCVIAADSKVYFCHDKAYVASGVVGDLVDRSFKDLWFDPEVVKRYKEFDACKECNHHCVYDDRNELLNTFFSLDKKHINFI